MKNEDEVDELSLFGTVAWVFPKGKMPTGKNSIRMCLSIKNTEGNDWESINFFINSYEAKTSWTQRYFYKNSATTVQNWCNDITSTTATTVLATPGFDSGWVTSAQYWDTANNRLLIDFERPLSWDIEGDSNDKAGDYHIPILSENTTYDIMVNYGVYTDNKATSAIGVKSSKKTPYGTLVAVP